MNEKCILIIDDDKRILSEYENELRREKRLGNRYRIITVDTAQTALEELARNVDIQFVLLDWKLRRGERFTKGSMLRELRKIRPRIFVGILTDMNSAPKVDGAHYETYYDKSEKDFDKITRDIDRELKSLSEAPFFDALKRYVEDSQDAWHTPGHSAGDSVRTSDNVGDFYDFFGANMFQADLSVSVPKLDSLLEPVGIIKQSQDLAAKTFGSMYTIYCTNGTTTANKILLQTLLKPLDKILLDRNCHKSVHYSVISSFLHPIYLQPSKNEKYGILAPVPLAEIRSKIEQFSNIGNDGAKAIIVTNCTYDGLIYNLKEIVDIAHKHGIKVIVDEAWFGYSYFHPVYRSFSAMNVGADYATQSTHKVMSAFSQASMIHVRDSNFDESMFREIFMMHTSTSPQYTMIASLDVARKQMYVEGHQYVDNAIGLAKKLRSYINGLTHFKVLNKTELIPVDVKDDGIELDELKVTIDTSRSGYTAKEVMRHLLDRHIQIEKSTLNTITVLVTIGTTNGKVERFKLAMEELDKEAVGISQSSDATLNTFPKELRDPEYFPSDAFYHHSEWVELSASERKIAGGMVVPYPPGIPVVLPGQIIDKSMVDYLSKLKDNDIEIHGMKNRKIKVLKQNHGLNTMNKRTEELRTVFFYGR